MLCKNQTFLGRILKDEQTLSECNIDSGSTVHLVKGKSAAASGGATGASASTGVGAGAGAGAGAGLGAGAGAGANPFMAGSGMAGMGGMGPMGGGFPGMYSGGGMPPMNP